MKKEFKAAIHRETRGKYSVYSVAYGRNPHGPQGGSCGYVVDGKFITDRFAGTGSFGAGAPNWMYKLTTELESRQLTPGTFHVNHNYGSRGYEIKA